MRQLFIYSLYLLFFFFVVGLPLTVLHQYALYCCIIQHQNTDNNKEGGLEQTEFIRKLDDAEYPLIVQEKNRRLHTESIKFIFKNNNTNNNNNNNAEIVKKVNSPPMNLFKEDDDLDDRMSTSPPPLNIDNDDDNDNNTQIQNNSNNNISNNSLPTSKSASFPPTAPSIISQAMSNDSTIIRCGYLEKRGKRNTAFKERWFILRQTGLYYYKSHQHAVPIATISLHDVYVQPVHKNCVNGIVTNNMLLPFQASPSITNLTISPGLPIPHSHSSVTKCCFEFELVTAVRIFYFRCRNYPEMMNWINDINNCIPISVENHLIDEIDLSINDIEYMDCIEEEDRLSYLLTLDGLLNDSIGIEQLVQYESDNKNEKYVLFYLEVEGFQRIYKQGNKSKQTLLDRAKNIYENFLSNNTNNNNTTTTTTPPPSSPPPSSSLNFITPTPFSMPNAASSASSSFMMQHKNSGTTTNFHPNSLVHSSSSSSISFSSSSSSPINSLHTTNSSSFTAALQNPDLQCECQKIKSMLDKNELSPTLFTPLQQFCYQYLYRYSFPQFLQSKNFQRVLLKLSMISASAGGINNELNRSHSIAQHHRDHRALSVSYSLNEEQQSSILGNNINNNQQQNNNHNHHHHNSIRGRGDTMSMDPHESPTDSQSYSTLLNSHHHLSKNNQLMAKGEEENNNNNSHHHHHHLDDDLSVSSLTPSVISPVFSSTLPTPLSPPLPLPLVSSSPPLRPIIRPQNNNQQPSLSSKDMSPASLASYLESIGEADAMKRTASMSQANNTPHHHHHHHQYKNETSSNAQGNTGAMNNHSLISDATNSSSSLSSSSTTHLISNSNNSNNNNTIVGDSDSDSEAENESEEIFSNSTPKSQSSSSYLDPSLSDESPLFTNDSSSSSSSSSHHHIITSHHQSPMKLMKGTNNNNSSNISSTLPPPISEITEDELLNAEEEHTQYKIHRPTEVSSSSSSSSSSSLSSSNPPPASLLRPSSSDPTYLFNVSTRPRHSEFQPNTATLNNNNNNKLNTDNTPNPNTKSISSIVESEFSQNNSNKQNISTRSTPTNSISSTTSSSSSSSTVTSSNPTIIPARKKKTIFDDIDDEDDENNTNADDSNLSHKLASSPVLKSVLNNTKSTLTESKDNATPNPTTAAHNTSFDLTSLKESAVNVDDLHLDEQDIF